jgi:hypothetical protein
MALPPDFTQQQKEYLERLWKSNTRELIDVIPSHESKKLNVSGTTYQFVRRLYCYCHSLLSKAIEGTIDQSSCLHDFITLVFVSNKVQLLNGRRVLALQHEEFLTELNRFEWNGQEPSQDFIRRDSFGAFLYHKPQDALTALGCAMRLAMTMTYNTNNNSNAQQLQQDVAPHLDSSQLIVRFVRVQPQVQMIDIKTGLVEKFVCVKGHVVKGRPKQLRVATSDFACIKW